MPTFGEKLKKLRLSKDMSQDELAKLLNTSKQVISRYENNQTTPKIDVALNYANALHVPLDYLIDNTVETIEDARIKAAELTAYAPTHKIPILGRISAGLPLYAEENIEGYTYTELNGGAEYFALRVKGDSMNAARIFDGDIIIVRRQDIVENGSIAVVLVDDHDATVKIFSRHDNLVTLMPQSHNPVHQPQIYDLRETKIDVLGLVVKCEFSLI